MLSGSQVRMKQDKKPSFSRAGAAMVKMVSHSLITPCTHNPTAHYSGEAPARKGSTDMSENRTDASAVFMTTSPLSQQVSW